MGELLGDGSATKKIAELSNSVMDEFWFKLEENEFEEVLVGGGNER